MQLIINLILSLALNLCFTVSEVKLQTGQYLLDENGAIACRVVGSEESIKLDPVPVLTTKHFKEAVIGYQEVGKKHVPFILIELTKEGQSIFKEFSRNNVGKVSGTVIDDQLYTAITMQTELDIKFLEIQADVSKRKLRDLVKKLNKEIEEANR